MEVKTLMVKEVLPDILVIHLVMKINNMRVKNSSIFVEKDNKVVIDFKD